MFGAVDSVVLPMKPIMEMDETSDPHGFYQIVDDFAAQDFAKNYGGFARSDVAILEEQEDLTYVNNLLARLNERHSDGVLESALSDADLMLSHKSKYCQSASEKIKYYENLLEERDRRELERLDGEDKKKREQELKERRELLRQTLNPEEKEYLRKKAREREIDTLID